MGLGMACTQTTGQANRHRPNFFCFTFFVVFTHNLFRSLRFLADVFVCAENHIEDVLDSTDLERNSPYIMYKSCKQELLGIWFYDEVECEKMHTLLAKITLANKVSPVGQNEQKKKEEKGSAAGNEISDLLSELETDKRDKRERSTSSDGGTRKDKPTTMKAAHAKVTKAQLKSALARLVQKDEFIDMLYKEIINQ